MDLKNLISRIELADELQLRPQTLAKWSRMGLFPQPKLTLPDRVILYDREEVRRAIEELRDVGPVFPLCLSAASGRDRLGRAHDS